MPSAGARRRSGEVVGGIPESEFVREADEVQ